MMSVIFTICSIFILHQLPEIKDKERTIIYSNTEYTTTYGVDKIFMGVYSGRKSGFLKLNEDGTGEYKYDVFGFAPTDCKRSPIKFIWGFVVGEDHLPIKNKRHYGSSYKILLQSTGSNSFQGCRTVVLKDFILDRGNSLHVSSSDDWKKSKK